MSALPSGEVDSEVSSVVFQRRANEAFLRKETFRNFGNGQMIRKLTGKGLGKSVNC